MNANNAPRCTAVVTLKDGSTADWSGLAYAAMQRDLMEQLEAEGVNVNGEDKAEMLGEEDEEEDA